jgi:hypothetical protein
MARREAASLPRWDVDTFRAAFNRTADTVRVVALTSPT